MGFYKKHSGSKHWSYHIDINIEGDEEFYQLLEQFGAKSISVLARALHEEHELIMIEAKNRCPVDTGALKASGKVRPPKITDGLVIESHGSFGDADKVYYATYVHEILWTRHPIGQAKYYESALMEAVPGLTNRLSARLKSAMRSR